VDRDVVTLLLQDARVGVCLKSSLVNHLGQCKCTTFGPIHLFRTDFRLVASGTDRWSVGSTEGVSRGELTLSDSPDDLCTQQASCNHSQQRKPANNAHKVCPRGLHAYMLVGRISLLRYRVTPEAWSNCVNPEHGINGSARIDVQAARAHAIPTDNNR
jgi:hypothetical protein